MSELVVKIRRDKVVEVHIELPPGEQCAVAHEAMLAVLALLGAGVVQSDDAPAPPRIPEHAPQGLKTGGR